MINVLQCQQHKNPPTLLCLDPTCTNRLMCLLCQHNHSTFISVRSKLQADINKFKKTVDESIDSSMQIMDNLQAGGIEKEKKIVVQYFNCVKEDFMKFVDLSLAETLAVFRTGRNSDLGFLVRARIQGKYHELPSQQFKKILEVYEGKNLQQLVHNQQQAVLQQAHTRMQQFYQQCQSLFQKFNIKGTKKPPQIRIKSEPQPNPATSQQQQYSDNERITTKLKHHQKYTTNIPIQTILTDAYSNKKQIITVGYDKMLRIFDKQLNLINQKEFGNILTRIENIGGDMYAVGLSKELVVVKVGQDDGYEVKNLLSLKGHKERIWDISAFNTRVVASCSEEGTKIWDLYKQKCQYTVQQNINPSCIKFMPSANTISIGYHSHQLKLYSLSSMKTTRSYQLKGVPLYLSQQNRNQNFIYCGGFNSEIYLFDIRVSKEVLSHHFYNCDAVTCFRQSVFQQEAMIIGHRDGNARLFDLRKLKDRVQWSAHPKKGNLSKPNGIIRVFEESLNHILTVGSNDCKAIIWELNNNQQ